MNKVWQITLKDLRVAFSDRNLLLIMFAAPLVLVSIIGFTFGRATSGTPLAHIPVAVVNLDAGADGSPLNYGDMLTALLVSGAIDAALATGSDGGDAAFTCPTAADGAEATGVDLDTLIDGTVFDSAEAARAAVAAGDYSVAVIIPEAFTGNLAVSQADPNVRPTEIEVHTSPAAPIAGQIVISVVDQMTTQFSAGNVALAALIDSLPQNPLQIGAIMASAAFSEGIACAFANGGAVVSVARQTPDSTAGDNGRGSNFLLIIGSAQAIFFAMFVANGMAGTIISERRDGTLQRMLVTPTPAVMVLLGKISAVFVIVFLQLVVLFVGLAVISPLISGVSGLLWGTNFIGLLAGLLATAFATAGIGSITAAVARNEEQAGTIGGVVTIFMGLFGGAFGFTMPSFLNNLSLIHWGQSLFTRLGSGSGDILVNLIVLMLIGAVSLAIAFVLFRHKIADR